MNPGESCGERRAVVRGLRRAAEPVAALTNRLRAQLYDYVRTRARPVSRDEVAAQAGISARLAGFHLDTLAKKGLLQASYARKPGRTGPGAGRSSKYYQTSGLEIDLSIPERRYDLLGDILVAALDAPAAGPSREAALRAAHQTGHQLGGQVKQQPDSHAAHAGSPLEALHRVLSDYGFEPHADGTEALTLANCPFHALACQHPELVCPLNQSLITGLLRGLETSSVEAALEPAGGRCCVTLRPRPSPHLA